MTNKKHLFIFLFVFLLIVSVSAVDIEVKDSVKKGENFIVKISGTFVTPLKTSQVEFYRQHMTTTFSKVNLEKIEGDYYFYLAIPETKLADNYSIVLTDV